MNEIIGKILNIILLLGFALLIVSIKNDIGTLQKTIDNLKPVDACAWLYPESKRSAAIYDRFKNEIRIECQGKNGVIK